MDGKEGRRGERKEERVGRRMFICYSYATNNNITQLLGISLSMSHAQLYTFELCCTINAITHTHAHMPLALAQSTRAMHCSWTPSGLPI